MAIEKRKTPSGKTIGWDTVRKCYCPLPKDAAMVSDYTFNPDHDQNGDDWTIPKLRAYAEQRGIELGYALTRKDDIIAEIAKHA